MNLRATVSFATATNWRGIIIRLALVLLFVVLTNSGFADRFKLLLAAERYTTLIPWIVIWGLSLGAMVVAALQPSRVVRVFWAVVLSASTAAGVGYGLASGSDISVFDVISLWNARHESGRALEFYRYDVLWAALVFVIGFFLLVAPPVPQAPGLRRALKWLGFAPAVPVAIIAAIVLMKSGGGSQVMPRQFQTLALGMVAGSKVATARVLPRRDVTTAPERPAAVRNIVVLVDESLRADYIDWRPGNPYTPQMAAARDRFVDFGQAVSGGNCSAYSNAILRLGAARSDLVSSINTSPTIWQYAKRAGFRTVFIDGQSGFIKNPGRQQNFMTMGEAADIDEFVTFDGDVSLPELDFQVLSEIARRLDSDQPVFIYANKNGAHFPYDEGYPESEAVFRPTVEETGDTASPIRVNSYRNVIRWSVDGFFQKLFDTADLSHTAIVYTSDHGQAFADGRLTHCSVENPDPREGLVPLMAITGDAGLKARFARGADLNRQRASHFAITPTLLDLMGYGAKDVRTAYGASLFEAGDGAAAFTSGDLFGLFRNEVSWTALDLKANHKEAFGDPLPAGSPRNTVELKAGSRPIN